MFQLSDIEFGGMELMTVPEVGDEGFVDSSPGEVSEEVLETTTLSKLLKGTETWSEAPRGRRCKHESKSVTTAQVRS